LLPVEIPETFVAETSFHTVPLKKLNLLVVVLYKISPLAGEGIELRCAVVKRGGKNPIILLFTSSMAELSGEDPSVLIAVCAFAMLADSTIAKIPRKMILLYMV
jgi:hypothetical protein